MTHMQPQSSPAANDNVLKGWHVLLILIGFFGVMFSVNGVFLYHAITSFPGEDVKKSYVQGLNYNQTLAQRADQLARGWRAEAGLDGAEIRVFLSDENSAPLAHQVLVGELRRSTTDALDRPIVFENRGNGIYTVPIQDLTPGRWLLRASALDADAEQILFEFEKSLTVG